VRALRNRCAFCFLKGLPRHMRRTLYVKDDDYRYSFLFGNFVTSLTWPRRTGSGSPSSV